MTMLAERVRDSLAEHEAKPEVAAVLDKMASLNVLVENGALKLSNLGLEKLSNTKIPIMAWTWDKVVN